MVNLIGWVATAVFAVSYFSSNPLRLRLIQRIRNPKQIHVPRGGVDDGVGGAGVAIARLTHRARVGEIFRRLVQWQRSVIGKASRERDDPRMLQRQLHQP